MCTHCIAMHYFVHDKLQIIQQQHVLFWFYCRTICSFQPVASSFRCYLFPPPYFYCLFIYYNVIQSFRDNVVWPEVDLISGSSITNQVLVSETEMLTEDRMEINDNNLM